MLLSLVDIVKVIIKEKLLKILQKVCNVRGLFLLP